MLAALLACIIGLNQWKADRIQAQCDGSTSDVKEYVLERKILVPIVGSCCCDESCAALCSCVIGYSGGAWLEVDRIQEPGFGPEICFDWDVSLAGDFRGQFFPQLGEVWWMNSYAIDYAGNSSAPCANPLGPVLP